MDYKTYTRKEYLEWCKEHNIKNPLPERRRNKFTISGYPTVSNIDIVKSDTDTDCWYKNMW